ncbi:MAG: hypothetical protein JEY79_00485 [Pseudodesulfovibrio sp.]|jgi:hypothetical protein|nr:hypothetical protein [Pseudodesulfovibrio sp.]
MSGIAALGSMSEYLPNRTDEEPERIEPANQVPNDEVQSPFIRAADQQQAQKTTMQAFQYTGKGSFVDKVF